MRANENGDGGIARVLKKKKLFSSAIVGLPSCVSSRTFKRLHNCTCVFSLSLCFSQEVILKRAADLVEALYGLPHNNQVSNKHTGKYPCGKRKRRESICCIYGDYC